MLCDGDMECTNRSCNAVLHAEGALLQFNGDVDVTGGGGFAAVVRWFWFCLLK